MFGRAVGAVEEVGLGVDGVAKAFEAGEGEQGSVKLRGFLNFAQAGSDVAADSFEVEIGAGVVKEAVSAGAVGGKGGVGGECVRGEGIGVEWGGRVFENEYVSGIFAFEDCGELESFR